MAPDMIPQSMANILWRYATIKRMPGDKTWAALEIAGGAGCAGHEPAGRGEHRVCVCDPLHLANLVCGLEAQDFSDEGFCMRFYIHLMHHSGQCVAG